MPEHEAETACTPPAPDPARCAEPTCPHTAQACPHGHVNPPASEVRDA